jgi:predicted amidohydrolase YtcJ
MIGLHVALSRQPWMPDLPDQRQSLAGAVAAYTREAAYAEFQEQVKGQLKRGMLADLVLLSEDIAAAPVEMLAQVRPLLTMCNGAIVYQS